MMPARRRPEDEETGRIPQEETPEGRFVEGLFVPVPDAAPGDADPPSEAERLDESGNASMPPGGTYS
jgi:hypothetical protein